MEGYKAPYKIWDVWEARREIEKLAKRVSKLEAKLSRKRKLGPSK